MSFSRCTQDGGYLHHAFITREGQDVYKCTREDAANDKGRFFLLTSAGPIEVNVLSQKGSKGSSAYTVDFVDTERRRLAEESARINEELDKRAKLYRNNMAVLLEKVKYTEKYANPDED